MEDTLRESTQELGILVEGIYYRDAQDYLRGTHKNHVDGIIRIHNAEYQYINTEDEFLVHFNLQVCHHKVGHLYALPQILRSGSCSQEGEQLPDLSFTNTVLGECVEVREHVSYEDLQDTDFDYSFTNIKKVEDLKRVIVKRYSASLPDLSDEDILGMGVSITKLRLI